MKNICKSLLFLLSLPFLMVSCSNNTQNNDDNKNNNTTWVKETFDDPDIEEVTSGSSSGFLIDISVETKLIVGYSYSCTYTPTGNSTYYTCKSSNESLFTIVKENNEDTKFTINCLKAGNGYFTLYDKDEMILYRKIIRIRTPMPIDYALTYLYETPYFVGYPGLGNHTIAFTDKEGTGSLTGSDELESNIDLDFTITLATNYQDYLSQYQAMGNVYAFTISSYDNNQTTSIVPQIMFLSLAGDFIRFYYGTTFEEATLLNIFYPSDELALHGLSSTN